MERGGLGRDVINAPNPVWERTCARRLSVRLGKSTGCTGAFADKSAPTGFVPGSNLSSAEDLLERGLPAKLTPRFQLTLQPHQQRQRFN